MVRNTRAITAGSYLAMFFLGVGASLIGATARSIGLTAAQIGLLLALQNIGFMAAVLVSGALADTHDKARMMSIGGVILAASFLTFYWTELFWVNLLIMMLSGVGMGTFEGVADALLIDLHGSRAGFQINVNHFFVTLGAIVISLYQLAVRLNWRLSVIEAGAGVLLVAVFFAATRITQRAPASGSYRERFRILASERLVIVFFLMAVLAVGVETGTIGILTTYLAEARGFDGPASRVGLVIFLAGMAGGRLVIGWLSRTEQIPHILLALLLVASALFSGIYLLDLTLALTYIAIFLAGGAMSALLPLMLALAGLRYRTSSGTVLGAIKVAIPIGGIVIPFAMSLLAGSTALRLALLVFPAALALGAGLLLTSGVIGQARIPR